MNIFSKEQIYEGDKITVERQNISSSDLMERAGTEIFNWLQLRLQGAQVLIHIFCGIGNNGGDGLVVARHLISHGYKVNSYIVNYSDKRSKDFLINYERIKSVSKNWPVVLNSQADFPIINAEDIIIDAVFGIGLNRPADTWIQLLFQHFKISKAFTLSIDMPSGLYMDKVPENENAVVWADVTVTFQTPKLVFFLPNTGRFTNTWEILDIGIDRDYFNNITTDFELVGKYEVLALYQPRDKFSHKGNFGHALIIGGSYGKIGAVTLSSKAALASGAGLITAYIPKCGYEIVQTAFPEAMVITDDSEKIITDINYYIEASAIGIGMGLGTDPETVKTFENFLSDIKRPLVIDADALNILSKHKSLLKLLPANSILTPHPKELERLIGNWKDDFEKLQKVKDFSTKHNVIIVIKGANTIVVSGDKSYINTTGNPGLATAGSGDVLTGIITGLMAQGYKPIDSAIFGVYLHGKSADIAIEGLGYHSLISSHVIDNLGKAFLSLFEQAEPLPKEE